MNKETQVVVAGTGATLSVALGFIPDIVEILNTNTLTELKWSAKDSDNVNGVAVAAAGTKTSAASAAAGIVATDFNASGRGFTLGASATVNVSADDLLITAKMIDYDTTSGDNY